MKGAFHSRDAAALVAILLITALLAALSAVGAVPSSPEPGANSAVGTTVAAQKIVHYDNPAPAMPRAFGTQPTTTPGTTTTTGVR
jgi:hypothetical protein